MVKLKGSIKVKRINGRNGPFSVGTLVTSIGEFAVKSAMLDQYDEGLYQGEFVVNHIGGGFYTTGGRVVVETRAIVTQMIIARAELGPIEGAPLEVDPLDEEALPKAVAPQRPAPEQKPAVTPQKPARPEAPVEPNKSQQEAAKPPQPTESVKPTAEAQTGTGTAGANADDPDAKLFGELWPLENVVKLDPTDRARLRMQADRLKGMGYKFEAQHQHWVKKAA